MPMSDNEQKQMLKDWWKEYGNAILLALLAFAVINFGWRYWNQNKYQQMESASLAYTQLLSAVEQQKIDEVKLFASKLMHEQKHSVYASMAAFFLAKNAVQNNDLSAALEKLQWIVVNTKEKNIKQIAKLRAARILIALQKPQQALDMLAQIDDASFNVLINEVISDAHLALNHPQEAERAIQQAKRTNSKSPLLQLKLQQF